MFAAFEEQSLVFAPGSVRYDQVFADYLQWCAEQFWGTGHGTYYAPYVVLFQSSMTGKSRLLTELAQNTFFSVMICVREESEIMQPPRTEPVAAALLKTKISSSEALMTRLLKSYLETFQEWVVKWPACQGNQIKPKDWHDQQKRVDVEVGKALTASNTSANALDWTPVMEKLGQHNACSCLDILFVFDEARALLNQVDEQGVSLFRYVLVDSSMHHRSVCSCVTYTYFILFNINKYKRFIEKSSSHAICSCLLELLKCFLLSFYWLPSELGQTDALSHRHTKISLTYTRLVSLIHTPDTRYHTYMYIRTYLTLTICVPASAYTCPLAHTCMQICMHHHLVLLDEICAAMTSMLSCP
jgi:hypothetical protein